MTYKVFFRNAPMNSGVFFVLVSSVYDVHRKTMISITPVHHRHHRQAKESHCTRSPQQRFSVPEVVTYIYVCAYTIYN